jgi:hypothetical protein
VPYLFEDSRQSPNREAESRMSYFPSPVEHASILIEVCDGSVSEARTLARDNQDSAQTDADYRYWRSIEVALTPEAACQAN